MREINIKLYRNEEPHDWSKKLTGNAMSMFRVKV
jgi:hypothetical protein